LKRVIQKIAKNDRIFFALFFFPHYFSEPFDEAQLIELLTKKQSFEERTQGKKEAVAAPRGFAKTTILNTLEHLDDILNQYERFIVNMSDTATVSGDQVSDIRLELEDNDLVKEIYGDLVNPSHWRLDDFVTKTGIRMVAKSFGRQVRGLRHRNMRPTKYTLDDPESLENSSSSVQRHKLKEYLKKDVLKGGTAKTNFRHLGTVINGSSLLAENLTNPGWNATIYKSIISWPERQDLWENCKKIYCDISQKNHREDAKEFYLQHKEEMCAGSRLLLPKKETLFDLYEMIWVEGLSAFMSEKQNEPRDDSRQPFDPEKFSYFMIEGDEIVRHDGRRIPVSSLGYYGFVDSTVANVVSSIKKNRDPDYAAIVVIGKESFEHTALANFYVVDCFLERVPISRQMPAVFDMAARWMVIKMGIEANGFQQWGINLYKTESMMRRERNQPIYCPLQPVTQNQNKQDRIYGLEPKISSQWLLFNRNLPREYFAQWDNFPNDNYNDDAPDATEGAVSLSNLGGLNVY
jgi:predicted phage terminase large subunit-like protein